MNEYEHRRNSKQQNRLLSDRESLNVASQQADQSTDVTELYPPKDRRDAMCRIASSFMNAFASKVSVDAALQLLNAVAHFIPRQ